MPKRNIIHFPHRARTVISVDPEGESITSHTKNEVSTLIETETVDYSGKNIWATKQGKNADSIEKFHTLSLQKDDRYCHTSNKREMLIEILNIEGKDRIQSILKKQFKITKSIQIEKFCSDLGLEFEYKNKFNLLLQLAEFSGKYNDFLENYIVYFINNLFPDNKTSV